MKILTTSILLTISLSLLGQAPAIQWDISLGGTSFERRPVMAPAPDGGHVIAGYSFSDVGGDKSEPGLTIKDWWVIKVDQNGLKVWDKTLGGSDNQEEPNDIFVNASNEVYVLGRSASSINIHKSEESRGGFDYWIIKLDANGNKIWDKTLGGTAQDGVDRFDVEETTDGGVIVGGQSRSGISGDKTEPSQGDWDYWIIKLSASGAFEWDKTLGGSMEDVFSDLQQTNDGGYIIGGFSNSPVSGDKSSGVIGDYDLWIVKVSSTGVKEWDKTIGSAEFDMLISIDQLSSGNYMVGANMNSLAANGAMTDPSMGKQDFWLAELDGSGNVLWDRAYGGSDTEWLYSAKTTLDGGFVLFGSSLSPISGEKSETNCGTRAMWVVKTDGQGTVHWDKTISAGSEYCNDGYQSPDGGYLIGGYTDDGIVCDKTEDTEGSDDLWIVKLESTTTVGNPQSFDELVVVNPSLSHGIYELRNAQKKNLSIDIYSYQGQLIKTVILNTIESSIDITDQPDGVYFMSVSYQGDIMQTLKVVKCE